MNIRRTKSRDQISFSYIKGISTLSGRRCWYLSLYQPDGPCQQSGRFFNKSNGRKAHYIWNSYRNKWLLFSIRQMIIQGVTNPNLFGLPYRPPQKTREQYNPNRMKMTPNPNLIKECLCYGCNFNCLSSNWSGIDGQNSFGQNCIHQWPLWNKFDLVSAM